MNGAGMHWLPPGLIRIDHSSFEYLTRNYQFDIDWTAYYDEVTRVWLCRKKPLRVRSSVLSRVNSLNVLEGKVIGSCYPRYWNIKFRKFLRQIDRETHEELAIRMILDNYGPPEQKDKKIRK